MIFEVDDYTAGGTFCNIKINFVGPLEFKCYIKKDDLGATIEYIIKNENKIKEKLLVIQRELQNVVPSAPPKD